MKNFILGLIVGMIISSASFYVITRNDRPIEIISKNDQNQVSGIIKNSQGHDHDHDHGEDEMSFSKNTTTKEIFKKINSVLGIPGHEEEIIGLYDELMDKTSKSEEVISNYSNYLLSLNKNESARTLVEECIELYPKNNLCNGNLTNVHFGTDKLAKSFETCFKNTPNNPICHFNYGGHLMMKSNFEEAYETFRKVESMQDSDEGGIYFDSREIFFNIAQSAKKLNKLKEAREYFDRACMLSHEKACFELSTMK